MKNNNIVNVTRMTNRNTWSVRVNRNNVSRSKAFSDSKYKGVGKALDAALAYGAYLQAISWARFAAPVITSYRKKGSSYNHFAVATKALARYTNV